LTIKQILITKNIVIYLFQEIIKVMSEVEKTIQNLPGGNIDNSSKEKNSAADNTVIQQDGLPTYNTTVLHAWCYNFL